MSGKVIKFAQTYQWEKVLELIYHEKDCDINEVDRVGRSPVIYAAMSHNFQILRELQACNANMKHVDINSMGATEYLNNFVYDSTTLDLNVESIQSSEALTGPTRAAKNGNTDDLNLCIELECDLNKVDGLGHTPLLIAVKEREMEIITILIEESNKNPIKVDINKPDATGRTAAIIATQYGYDDVLEKLLTDSQYIDIDRRDNEEKNAFDHAVSCNQKKCAKIIYEYNKNKQPQPQNQANNEREIGIHSPSQSIASIDIEEDEAEDSIDYDSEYRPSSKKGRQSTKELHQISKKALRTPPSKSSKKGKEMNEINVDLLHKKEDLGRNGVLESPMSDLGTPSKMELHESDSIDMRLYHQLVQEKVVKFQKDNESENDNENEIENGEVSMNTLIEKKVSKHGQQISIVITDADHK